MNVSITDFFLKRQKNKKEKECKAKQKVQFTLKDKFHGQI